MSTDKIDIEYLAEKDLIRDLDNIFNDEFINEHELDDNEDYLDDKILEEFIDDSEDNLIHNLDDKKIINRSANKILNEEFVNESEEKEVKKISFSEFVREFKKYLALFEKPRNNNEFKYINFILLFEFIIKHKYVLSYYQLSNYNFHDTMFNKLLKFMNYSYINKKSGRLDKIKQIKHELFPYSKLQDENEIVNILSKLISVNGIISIIILYLEPNTWRPTINTLINILKKMDCDKEIKSENMTEISYLINED